MNGFYAFLLIAWLAGAALSVAALAVGLPLDRWLARNSAQPGGSFRRLMAVIAVTGIAVIVIPWIAMGEGQAAVTMWVGLGTAAVFLGTFTAARQVSSGWALLVAFILLNGSLWLAIGSLAAAEALGWRDFDRARDETGLPWWAGVALWSAALLIPAVVLGLLSQSGKRTLST